VVFLKFFLTIRKEMTYRIFVANALRLSGIPLGLYGPGNDFTFKVLFHFCYQISGFIYFLGSKLYIIFHRYKEIGISKNAFLFVMYVSATCLCEEVHLPHVIQKNERHKRCFI
jgi:hypothetical protein